jgi:hypothetical protein
MKWTLFFVFAGALFAADEARVVFSKSFPGSSPEFMEVRVDKTGNVEYRDRPDDELPIKFRLSETETQEVFGLAEKLDYFKHELEAPVKVAFMGAKTFRYENGAQKSEVKFNYSQELPAQTLLDWFERMAESAAHRIDLERAAKYDKLGVDKAIRLLSSAMERKRLVGLEQYLPILDRISNNESYMHTARARAAEMAEFIRAAKPETSKAAGRL